MTTTLGTLGTLDALEPALSVRQVLALERVLAGEPEVVVSARVNSTGPYGGCTWPRPPTSA